MKRKQLILLSVLGLAAVGLVFYLLVGRKANSRQPATGMADSAKVATPRADIDTAADIRIIREYYTKAYGSPTNSVEERDKLDESHLTPLMAERSFADENDVYPFVRCEAVPLDFLKTLHVGHLHDNWYMVSWKQDSEPGLEKIPVRMVTDRNGHRKIGYVTPAGLGTAASDTIFHAKVVPMQAHPKSAHEFVEAFYRSYFSTFVTIDEHAHDARLELMRHCVERKGLEHASRDLSLGTMLVNNMLQNLNITASGKPRYAVYSMPQEGWFCVRGTYPHLEVAHYVKVEKHGSRYVIVRFQSYPPAVVTDKDFYIYFWPDKQPSFGAGQNDMEAFLNKYLQYPEQALQAGKGASVNVVMLTDKDGSLLSTEAEGDLSDPFVAEALQLLDVMPKWLPAGNDIGESVQSYVYGTLVFNAKGGNAAVKFIREYPKQR